MEYVLTTICGGCVMIFCCVLLTILRVRGVKYNILCTSSFYHMPTPPLTLLMTPLTSLPQPQFVSFQNLYFHDCTLNFLLYILSPNDFTTTYSCTTTVGKYPTFCISVCSCTCMYFISLGTKPFRMGWGQD